MKFKNHIGYRFLVDDDFMMLGLQRKLPDLYKKFENKIPFTDQEQNTFDAVAHLLRKEEQRAFFVTESVFDKLGMLKVKRNPTFGWTVFRDIEQIKYTFLFEGFRDPVSRKQYHSGLVRVMKGANGSLGFVHIGFKFKEGMDNFGTATFNYFYANCFTGEEGTEISRSQDILELAEFTYKMMCFIFLSENEFQIVAPGRKYGTKKSGRLMNDLPVPITTVTSKWNITSIRTEGFAVSGHFHIYHTGPGRTVPKLVFVNPFEKHGYVRKAKNSTE